MTFCAYALGEPVPTVTVLETGLHRMLPSGSVILTWYRTLVPGVRSLSTKPMVGRFQKAESPVVVCTQVLLLRSTSYLRFLSSWSQAEPHETRTVAGGQGDRVGGRGRRRRDRRIPRAAQLGGAGRAGLHAGQALLVGAVDARELAAHDDVVAATVSTAHAAWLAEVYEPKARSGHQCSILAYL